MYLFTVLLCAILFPAEAHWETIYPINRARYCSTQAGNIEWPPGFEGVQDEQCYKAYTEQSYQNRIKDPLLSQEGADNAAKYMAYNSPGISNLARQYRGDLDDILRNILPRRLCAANRDDVATLSSDGRWTSTNWDIPLILVHSKVGHKENRTILGITREGFSAGSDHSPEANDIDWLGWYDDVQNSRETGMFEQSLGARSYETTARVTWPRIVNPGRYTVVVIYLRWLDTDGEFFVQCSDVNVRSRLDPNNCPHCPDNMPPFQEYSQIPTTTHHHRPTQPPTSHPDAEWVSEIAPDSPLPSCPVRHASQCMCAHSTRDTSVHPHALFGTYCQCTTMDGQFVHTNPYLNYVWGGQCMYGDQVAVENCYRPAVILQSPEVARENECKIVLS